MNKMNIQEKFIQNYPLINKVDSELNCYVLDKKRYLVFWDELIKKDSTFSLRNNSKLFSMNIPSK